MRRGVLAVSRALIEYIPNQIWLNQYMVHFGGMDFYSRMTIIRLSNGSLMLHSPCNIDAQIKQAIDGIGPVAHIVAPGNFHHLHVASAQKHFPEAQTHVSPGVERKQPELDFDWFLGDKAPEAWRDDIEQVLVRGTRFIWEVAFFHKPSGTLVLTDLVENIGEHTEGVGWGLKLWFKFVFRMWNKARPAPEYQMGWKDKPAAARSLERILEWDFERVVLAHGDLVEANAKAVVRDAWRIPLGGARDDKV
jgi:hypothetical protein